MKRVQTYPPPATHGPAPQYPIGSVDNALQVLLLLGDSPSLRLTDISQYLGVASSTAHRLVAMLQFRGFVRQDAATRCYVSGPTLDALVFDLLRRFDVRATARPVLERLNTELLETVHIGRLEGSDLRFIDSIESSRALRVASRVGRTMPAHCTSTGKALLATLTEEELLRLYPDEALGQLTTDSIGSRSKLIKALRQVRDQGYATSNEESEEGVTSMAVALHSTRSSGLAINVSVPISRMTPKLQTKILSHLMTASDELDQILV